MQAATHEKRDSKRDKNSNSSQSNVQKKTIETLFKWFFFPQYEALENEKILANINPNIERKIYI